MLCAVAAASCALRDDAYGEAYSRGCLDGFRDAGGDVNDFAPKDDARYAADANYRKGWDDGHSKCYARQIRTPMMYSNGGGR